MNGQVQSPPLQDSAPPSPTQIVADMNGDGKDDLVLANGSPAIYLSMGRQGFELDRTTAGNRCSREPVDVMHLAIGHANKRRDIAARSSNVCSLTAALRRRNRAHGNSARQRSMVVESSVSDLWEELGLQPTVFCRWQKSSSRMERPSGGERLRRICIDQRERRMRGLYLGPSLRGFSAWELDGTVASLAPDSLVVFDSWTPASYQDSDSCAQTLALSVAKICRAGKPVWIYCDSTNTTALRGPEGAGFPRSFSVLRYRLL